MLGPTDPNRYYMWTGWDGNDGQGRRAGHRQRRARVRVEDLPGAAAGGRDQLEDLPGQRRRARRRPAFWGWTSDPYIGNYGDNSLLYFFNYQNAAPGSPLYQAARTGTEVNKSGGFFDILAADVKHDRLPSVSWIVAPEAYTEHPAWPAGYGAWYTAGVLNALTSDPEVWSKTALLITFDENDGFFDHVVGPYPNVGGLARPVDRAAGQRAVRRQGRDARAAPTACVGPYGLGVRVPLLVVSPWSRGGWVCSETFDHTSLIRFIEARFGVDEPNITPWRRAVCGDLTSAFDFESASRSRPAAAQRRRLQAERARLRRATTRRRRQSDRSRARSPACGRRVGSATASTSPSTPARASSTSRSRTAASSASTSRPDR